MAVPVWFVTIYQTKFKQSYNKNLFSKKKEKKRKREIIVKWQNKFNKNSQIVKIVDEFVALKVLFNKGKLKLRFGLLRFL